MVAHCHCIFPSNCDFRANLVGSMCRKITGALVFTAIMLPVKDLKWDTSEGRKPYSHSPSAYKTIESWPHILRGFCQECGSSLVYYNTKRTEIEILLGSIDDIEGAGFEITRAVSSSFCVP